MKNLYTLAVAMLFALGLSAQDSVNVVFAVDMNGVSSVSSNGVSVAGTIQDNYAGSSCSEWNPGCTVLSDSDGDGVWTIRLRLPATTYLYKYVNGNAWGNNEGGGLRDCGTDDGNGGFNRTLDLTNAPTNIDTVVGPFKYDSCTFSTIQVTSIDRGFANSVSMTLSPNPATDAVTVSFNKASAETFSMTLTTITGAVVRQEVATGSSVTLQRAELPAGIYFITLSNRKGERATQKVIFR